MKNYKPTAEKLTVDSYPYGSLRTTAYFSIEFKSGKGFRGVFQTVNPITSILNKEKKGTYSPVMLQYIDTETNHVERKSFDFYGIDGINKDCMFMYEHFDLFTTEQIKDIFAYVAMKIKAEIQATVVYCGADFEALKPFFTEALKNALHGFKTGENIFNTIQLDAEGIKATHKPNFNPFKVTSYGTL